MKEWEALGAADGDAVVAAESSLHTYKTQLLPSVSKGAPRPAPVVPEGRGV